jgi:hypothetical protein
MRTTLTLEPDVAAKLRAEMRRTGHSFKQVVNDLLRERLIQREMQGPLPPFQVKARALGERPGLNYDCISALLEQIEGPGYK